MNLILLQPGDPGMLGDDGSTIDRSGWATGGPSGACVEIVSMHQGMKQPVTTDVSNAAHTSGRPIVTELTLTKYVDAHSVRFYEYCLGAIPLGRGPDQPTLLYLARNSGGQTVTIMTVALRDAIVSEIQLQTHPDDMPTEQFKLHFTEVVWTRPQPNANAVNAVNATGWSLAKNRPVSTFSPNR